MESELTKKAYWQSRRGLQELDLILIPFVEDCFADLNHEDKITFLDFKKIANVVYDPLRGFMNKDDLDFLRANTRVTGLCPPDGILYCQSMILWISDVPRIVKL